MKRVFLSHSSKDKGYVEKVAEKLGFDNCVYDKYTFETGMDTLEEIFHYLEETDIFVFFISDSALESKWVKKERIMARRLFESGSILRFFPIIIDNKVDYTDSRIPKWMKDHFNIRPINSPNAASNKIKARMREVVWKVNPGMKRRNLFFIGRNDAIKMFEERRSDFGRDELKCIDASSAFPGIGRKAYMSHVLKKGNIMDQSYVYNLITLEKQESIEDFILKISDLGRGHIDIVELALMSMDKKIDVAVELVKEFQHHNEFIFINDEGVLVMPNSRMADWFNKIIERIDPKIVFGIASTYKLHTRYTNDAVFSIQMHELEPSERRLMLREYCNLENINISKEQLRIVSDNLSGYPEQVFYAVQFIKDVGIGNAMSQMSEIRRFADERSTDVLKTFVDSDEKLRFLVFLASFDFVGYEILETVYKKWPVFKEYMDSFVSISVCEMEGADGEYIRVNDVLRDILFRRKLTMGDDLEELFHEIVSVTVDEEFVLKTDLSRYYSVIRAKLDSGDVDEKYVIPSHYLKSIVNQYNSRQYEKAIRLCKRIVDGDRTRSFDIGLIDEIHYYYCQSLARAHKSDEFFKEIEYSGFRKEDYSFLRGFFFRINGNPQKAIENLKTALDERPGFAKARRELASAYFAAEDYEAAETVCWENYCDDRRNPFFIQQYFDSLIHHYYSDNNLADEVDKILKELIDTMKTIDLPQSGQMLVCMKARYYDLHNEFNLAMQVVDEGIQKENDGTIYIYLTKFDIAHRNGQKEIMASTIESIESIVEKERYFSNALYRRKARYYIFINDKGKAKNAISKMNNMPDSTMRKFEMEILGV